jgi:Na+/H+ antiporter NhaC
VSFVLLLIALSFKLAGEANLIYPKDADLVAGSVAAVGALLLFIVLAYQASIDQQKRDERVEAAERRAEEHPQETRAAWDLARIKLEQYLDRNLKQVRSIFWLSLLVMGIGFLLIGYGVIMVYRDPANFNASIVSAVSGIVVNFIGATFLVIYRSTMEQAKDYVAVLERINAVGMSVQILDKMDESDAKMRNQATSDIAKQLLLLYG